MRELALFAGAGGGILGSLLLGHEIVAAVEFNPYRQEVLRQRQRDGMLPPFPIFDDVRTFDCAPWRGKVDLVSGGFPCQPFSTAGSRKGEDDERNMWPDTARIIREVGPLFLFLENVPALLADRYFGRILGDLAESGYDALWDCVPASAVGAPHQRDRLWIFATRRGLSDADRELLRIVGEWHTSFVPERRPSELGDDGADANTAQVGRVRHDLRPRAADNEGKPSETDEQDRNGSPQPKPGGFGSRSDRNRKRWWSPESRPPFVAHGVAQRVEQLEATGDGQVPLVAAYAFVRLAEAALEAGLGEADPAKSTTLCPLCCGSAIAAGLARPGKVCQACELKALGARARSVGMRLEDGS